MNVKDNPTSNVPWTKIAIIVAVFVLVLVFSGRAGLEELLGLKAGTFGGAVAEKNEEDSSTAETTLNPPKNSTKSTQSTPPVNEPSKSSSTSSKQNSAPEPETEFRLVKKNFVMESPQGLTYYVGDRGENRIEHVMRHSKDIPNRPIHGVFTGGETEILKTIDEAYGLIKSNSSRVLVEKRAANIETRMEYEIDMQRKIGFKGGKSGARDGNPDLRILKLILDKGTRVITAYPYR